MKISIICALITACAQLSAQSTALLMGEIQGDDIGYVRILGDTRYVDTREFAQTALINEAGKFGMLVPVQSAQLLQIEYAGKRAAVFLQPNDTLQLLWRRSDFPKIVWSSDKGGESAAAANRCWTDFSTQYIVLTDPMSLRQYRRGAYFYPISELEDRRMQTMPPDSFSLLIRRERWAQEQWAAAQAKACTDDFRAFLRAQIESHYLYRYLAYGHIYKGRWRLDAREFLSPLDSQAAALWSDAHLHNAEYRRFALAYTHWLSEGSDTAGNEYTRWYESAKKTILPAAPISAYATMAAILAQGLQREDPRLLNEVYRDFLQTNPYQELDYIVTDAALRTRRLSAGTSAPNFVLQDHAGREWALSDLHGKLVYIDFWASWCRPCMEKMEKMRTWQSQWTGQNIVFLHINLDDSESAWRASLSKYELTQVGTQLYHPAASRVALEYKIDAIPKFFLISADGNFAHTPSSADLDKLAETIKQMTK